MKVDVKSLDTFNQLAHEGAQEATRSMAQMTGIDAAVDVTRISLIDRADIGEELGSGEFVGVQFGFEGALWPVHPRRDSVAGVPAVRSVDDLPGTPDAVFVGVNRNATVDVVRALSAAGAGGAAATGELAAVNDPTGIATGGDTLTASGSPVGTVNDPSGVTSRSVTGTQSLLPINDPSGIAPDTLGSGEQRLAGGVLPGTATGGGTDTGTLDERNDQTGVTPDSDTRPGSDADDVLDVGSGSGSGTDVGPGVDCRAEAKRNDRLRRMHRIDGGPIGEQRGNIRAPHEFGRGRGRQHGKRFGRHELH